MSIHEECGVFGIYDPNGGCARTAYYGLYALQHRGQEAAGIATINDRELSYHKDLGLVGDVFDDETLERLNGTMAVGHVRYATTGGGRRENAQPPDPQICQRDPGRGPQRQPGEYAGAAHRV